MARKNYQTAGHNMEWIYLSHGEIMKTKTILKISAVASFGLIVVACASSSGIQRLGPDTFTVSTAAAPARGGKSGAKKMALEEANRYCTRMNKEILVTSIRAETTNYAGAGTSDITLQCLAKGDPDLQRPEYRRAPDTIIEDRR